MPPHISPPADQTAHRTFRIVASPQTTELSPSLGIAGSPPGPYAGIFSDRARSSGSPLGRALGRFDCCWWVEAESGSASCQSAAGVPHLWPSGTPSGRARGRLVLSHRHKSSISGQRWHAPDPPRQPRICASSGRDGADRSSSGPCSSGRFRGSFGRRFASSRHSKSTITSAVRFWPGGCRPKAGSFLSRGRARPRGLTPRLRRR